jgi:hypothetical protein
MLCMIMMMMMIMDPLLIEFFILMETGTLPPSWSRMTALQILDVHANSIAGACEKPLPEKP